MATLRHQMANIISVPLSLLRLTFIKLLYPKNIHFSLIERFSPNVVIDTDRKSLLSFGKRVSIHSNSRLVAIEGGHLSLGDHTSLNVGCVIVSRKQVTVGSHVSFGPHVTIYDHDHTLSKGRSVKQTPYTYGDVIIDDYTWIGANVTILAGTHIGKNCVIAAGSVVKGDVPDNTILIQKRTNTYKNVE